MCEWGITTKMNVWIPESRSRYGVPYVKPIDVDSCIAPIVRALNDSGIPTIASCCGHGKKNGNIVLHDGRILEIYSDLDSWRKAIEAKEREE